MRHLFLAIFSLIATSLVLAEDDALETRMKAISPTSVDCGTTAEGSSNRADVARCISEHFLANKPFRARFIGRCEDCYGATGIVLEQSPGGLHIVGYSRGQPAHVSESGPWPGTWLEPCNKPTLIQTREGVRLICKNEYRF